jgi:hypothetical protein
LRALRRTVCAFASVPERSFMGFAFLDYGGYLAFALPFLAIAAILLHYGLRRVVGRRKKGRAGASRSFFPSSAALGTIVLFAQIFYRPSIAHVVEVRREVEVDEDNAGDPETPARELERQFRRIRRGERVDRLVWRLGVGISRRH